MGYWPSESLHQGFNHTCLKDAADTVMWGGQVVLSNPQSSTAMGSGRKGSRGYGSAAYIANLLVYTPCAGNECPGLVFNIPQEHDLAYTEDDPAHFDVLADFENDNGMGRGPLYTGVYYGGSLTEPL